MLGGILILILLSFVAFAWINQLKVSHPLIDRRLLKWIYGYHILLSLAYFGYVSFNPSDSRAYYRKVISNFRGDTWMSFYGTSTEFIEWVGYPFIHFFGFSYEAMMVLFSFFGFIGFVYFYIFFKENIRFKHNFLGVDLLVLTFFLPNLHFWSSSFGKGSFIFMGIGLYFFGMSDLRRRIPAIILGSLIVYHVRPHVMLVVLVSSALAFVFSTKGLSLAWRLLFLSVAVAAFFFIFNNVLAMVGLDQEEFVSQGLDLSHRARELSKATSGVDISNYSLPMQVFTFLFRPLFVDAPGVLGIMVSFENVFYLLVTFRLLMKFSGWKFLFTGDLLSKIALFSFCTISIALAQVAGNLGLAMRQKSQIMILLMFIVLAYLDAEKFKVWKQRMIRRKKATMDQSPSTYTP
jgi:hypothetical protein